MSTKMLDCILKELDDVEKIQVIDGVNINDQHLDYDTKDIPKMPKESFFKEGDIFINKHHRFSYMPSHTHNFIEFNYMYSGSCTQYINDEKITLQEHDLILMDKDIIQRIDYVGENDIIVNILVKDDSVIELLRQSISQSSSIVTKFMYNASKMDAFHNNYMLFKLQNNEIAQNMIECMIMKYFETSHQKDKSLNVMMALLLSELSNSIDQQTSHFTEEENSILPILKYIDTHYDQVTLSSLSKQFGYNANYLGNKIKDETGSTFKELIEKKRLDIAQELLVATNYSTTEIAEIIGFHSAPSLFRLFQKHFHQTPNEYKAQNNHK
ncbi:MULTISPECIES: AraC family transcriptional regulator [Bacillota]|jgi:AraC-like DNA-binding protein|uniref:Helix-turn-helix transcriptional regulator n=2 Tax=Amedibacillus TaxID=2749846 RepID=A0A7G9GK33_9FIRM|nr:MULTISPECIES: AraC family transcriptional regulator [Bacillota]MCH4284784.1 AraC family transcriptional regulator [Amedibacillus hominis]QNM11165.1 helix-turn-helix transcriptional regulator [[Eubacterium] hominis]